MTALREFRRPGLWLALWALMITAVVAGSLLPARELPPVPFDGFDKFQHLFGYAVLSAYASMLFVDYGYPRGEYYQADRRDGTLRAFYRHRMHHDPLLYPGLQDLTASVDFTALAEAGVAAGFDFAGYCSQASFLLGNGLAGVLARIERIDDTAEHQRRSNEVKRLTLPSEMGERFQVMGFEKDVEFGVAFLAGDLSFRL